MARYRDLKAFLESHGFVEESVKNSHLSFVHRASDTVILLREMIGDSPVSPGDLVSARRHLVERGLVSEAEFATFLKVASLASKQDRP